MLAVILKYVGNTPKLTLTRTELSRPYTFDKDTGSESYVLYDDAKKLLENFGRSFKVASGAIEIGPEHLEPVEYAPEPIMQPPAGDTVPPNDESSALYGEPTPEEPALTGDGVEGTGDMPPIEEEPRPEAAQKKSGKKK